MNHDKGTAALGAINRNNSAKAERAKAERAKAERAKGTTCRG